MKDRGGRFLLKKKKKRQRRCTVRIGWVTAMETRAAGVPWRKVRIIHDDKGGGTVFSWEENAN